MLLKIFSFFSFFLFSYLSFAQDDNTADTLMYSNHVYKKNIHTPQLYKKGWLLSYPVIRLNSGEELELIFDDFSKDVKNYSIRFIHCDENWNPSAISITDYQSGFDYQDLMDYAYSFNTLQAYIHFTYSFPNDNIQLTKSGNYLLIIYENHEEENLVLTRRFYITEDIAKVDATVKPTSLPLYKKTHQEMDITVNAGSIPNCSSPASQVFIHVTQNDRPQLMRKNIQPTFIKDKMLIYQYSDSLIFQGNNEFRYFDTKSIRYQSEFIQAIKFEAPLYNIYLYPDNSKLYKQYVYYKDINGKYYVEIQEGRDNPVEADYVWVHFTLNYMPPFADGDVYVTGEMTDWEISSRTKMTYNYDNHQYNLNLLLKQGYYNYTYTFVKKDKKVTDDYLLEGSYYDTENDYKIYVYYKNPGSFFTRLVAFEVINTTNSDRRDN